MLPSAHAILWFLATFLALWAASLVVRGLIGERGRGQRRCPGCGKGVPTALTCGACGYEASSARDLTRTRPNFVMVAVGAVVIPVAVGTAYAAEALREATTRTGEIDVGLSPWDAGAAGMLAFGVILSAWAIRGDRSRGRRRCPECWYDMGGGGLVCPECGHDAGHASKLYKSRRYPGAAAMGAAIIAGAAVVHSVPLYLDGGWPAVVPATVSIAAFPWTPGWLIESGASATGKDYTLAGRLYGGKLSEWQNAWLQRKVVRTLESATSLDAVCKALCVARHSDRINSDHPLLIAARALSEGTDTVRAARCVAMLFWPVVRDADLEPALSAYIPGLIAAIRDPSQRQDTTWACVALIARCPIARAKDAAEIVDALGRAPRSMGSAYASALAPAAAQCPELREALRAAASSSNGKPNVLALGALIDPGRPISDDIFLMLAAVVRHGSDADAEAAAEALASSRAAREPVIEALLSQAESCRPNRAVFLSWLSGEGQRLAPYVPRLLALAGDPEPHIRVLAIGAIDSLIQSGVRGVDYGAIRAALETLQHDSDVRVSSAAAMAAAHLPAASDSK